MQEIAPRETTAPARGRVDGGHLALHAAVVVDEPGRPLESATQAVMERRFGFDFSRIRVHTDARAAESATSVNAVAYTVGQDVVFAPGAYSPERPEGLRLLAHELAHVVQSAPSRAGTGAVEPDARRAADAVAWTSDPVRPVASAPFGTVLRQEAAEAALNPATVRSTHPFDRPRLLTEELQRPEPLVTLPPVLPPLRLERFTDPLVERAVDRLLLALDRPRGTPEIARAWPRVLEQVRRPGIRPARNAPAELYEPDLVETLDALTPGGTRSTQAERERGLERQAEVLQRVFTVLLADTDKRLDVGAGSGGDPETEYRELLSEATRKDVGAVSAYRGVRSGLLASFGALEVGTATAIDRMNSFYERAIVSTEFLGRRAQVHASMRARLASAESRLGKDERAAIAKQVSSVGGLSVRPNANNPLKLSEHSFGAAIDINAEMNPNVPDFPSRFVEDVTSVDLWRTPEGRRKSDVFDLGELFKTLVFGQKDPALRELERLLGASRRLVEIFTDDAGLATGMVEVARRMSHRPLAVNPAGLLALVREARAEGPKVHWRFQDPRVRIPRNARPGSRHDALATLLFPPIIGPEPLDVWSDERRTVELLIQMADVYERSFAKPENKPEKGKSKVGGEPQRVPPSARAASGEAALPQLVAHGFLNLPARLVSALRAPDGGDLAWLGTAEHTKDFMHFEVRPTPPLY
jgi:hypothetical protein